MSTITINIPEEVAAVVRKYSDVDWKFIAEQSIADHPKKLAFADDLVKDSKLTEADVDALDRLLKHGLAERYRSMR